MFDNFTEWSLSDTFLMVPTSGSFYGTKRIWSRINICRTLSSVNIAVVFLPPFQPQDTKFSSFREQFWMKKVKSAWFKIWKNRQRIVLMHIWKLDTQKRVAKMMKQKTYFHLKATMVKYISILERFNKQFEIRSSSRRGRLIFGQSGMNISMFSLERTFWMTDDLTMLSCLSHQLF